MRIWDYLILAAVALIVFLAIRHNVRRKASGAACGCGGCAGCSASGHCAQSTERK